MITFRMAHYRSDGTLIRVSDVYPIDDPPDPQATADRCAKAADAGCTYGAGTFLVWVDHSVQPGSDIGKSPRADGARSYGGDHTPKT